MPRKSKSTATSAASPGHNSMHRDPLRGGIAREDLMHWCETNDVDWVFGLARNPRLQDPMPRSPPSPQTAQAARLRVYRMRAAIQAIASTAPTLASQAAMARASAGAVPPVGLSPEEKAR
jgi:hypothetical protein